MLWKTPIYITQISLLVSVNQMLEIFQMLGLVDDVDGVRLCL
jgi:hypothetical protein